METRPLKFWAGSQELLAEASRAPSAGWRRPLSCLHRGAPRGGQPPGGRVVLTGGSVRYSWCLCSRSPAGYARVRRLSPHSPSCMLLWTGPSWSELSRAERTGWAPCVMQEEPEGWLDVFTERPGRAESVRRGTLHFTMLGLIWIDYLMSLK